MKDKQLSSNRLKISSIRVETHITEVMFVAFVSVFVFPQVGIKELENEKLSLQSGTEHYSDQVAGLHYVLV